MWGIIIPLLIGIAIGYFTPGRTDKSKLYLRALMWGVVIAIVLAIIGWATQTNPLGIGDTGVIGMVISFAISLAILVLGVWIGDWIEHRQHGEGGRRVNRV